ncbi:hypothetical protein G7Y89_g15096 [Cudoniella acicularis]|uniref:mannan endo-1,6-alpha-mannosidase n=1 Tax=Cudoniella acicularis TaxID=354080 RepID=A0A8H4VPB8_9HELO|nr:hypothetical protein G7Y89_g15096 [Cudoniella acicularis]
MTAQRASPIASAQKDGIVGDTTAESGSDSGELKKQKQPETDQRLGSKPRGRDDTAEQLGEQDAEANNGKRSSPATSSTSKTPTGKTASSKTLPSETQPNRFAKWKPKDPDSCRWRDAPTIFIFGTPGPHRLEVTQTLFGPHSKDPLTASVGYHRVVVDGKEKRLLIGPDLDRIRNGSVSDIVQDLRQWTEKHLQDKYLRLEATIYIHDITSSTFSSRLNLLSLVVFTQFVLKEKIPSVGLVSTHWIPMDIKFKRFTRESTNLQDLLASDWGLLVERGAMSFHLPTPSIAVERMIPEILKIDYLPERFYEQEDRGTLKHMVDWDWQDYIKEPGTQRRNDMSKNRSYGLVGGNIPLWRRSQQYSPRRSILYKRITYGSWVHALVLLVALFFFIPQFLAAYRFAGEFAFGQALDAEGGVDEILGRIAENEKGVEELITNISSNTSNYIMYRDTVVQWRTVHWIQTERTAISETAIAVVDRRGVFLGFCCVLGVGVVVEVEVRSLNMWFYTNDTSYNDNIQQGMLFQVGPDWDYLPPNQTLGMGNDDQGFWALSAMTAAELNFPNPPLNGPQWLPLAQAVFNEYVYRYTLETLDSTNCNGGLRWQVNFFTNGYNYKNSISNGCFFNLGARLAKYTNNNTYAQWAETTWEWIEGIGLMQLQGYNESTVGNFSVDGEGAGGYVLWDGTDLWNNCTSINGIPYSYNAGIWLYGAATMYNYTNGSPLWANRTTQLLNATLNVFFNNASIALEPYCERLGLNLTVNPACTVDMYSFKAFLSRWLALTSQLAPFTAPIIAPYLSASAVAATKQCIGGANGRMYGGTGGDVGEFGGG